MKIAAISDTHGRPFTIPECDVFIHAGDITPGGSLPEVAGFAYWLGQQKQVKSSIIVPGNHDAIFQQHPSEADALFFGTGASVLVDQGITFFGKTFWGSPWTPHFMEWSFMKDEDALEKVYEKMPQKLDVLITHGPPRGILDPGWQSPHVGSEALLDAVACREIRHHLFGHLHAAGGKDCVDTRIPITRFHNLAAVDEAYNSVRGCLEFEL